MMSVSRPWNLSIVEAPLLDVVVDKDCYLLSQAHTEKSNRSVFCSGF